MQFTFDNALKAYVTIGFLGCLISISYIWLTHFMTLKIMKENSQVTLSNGQTFTKDSYDEMMDYIYLDRWVGFMADSALWPLTAFKVLFGKISFSVIANNEFLVAARES